AQFKRVKGNTTYYQPAHARLGKINTIKSVIQTMNSLRLQLGLESEQAREDGNRDTPPASGRVSRGEESTRPATVDSSVTAIDTVKAHEDLAYAMFRYGEILLFEMSDSTGGQEIMADIVLNFDQTEVAPQAAYVLYVTASGRPDQAEFWRSIITEKYSNSPYGLFINARRTDTGSPQLDSLMTLANTAVPAQPYRALQLFREIQSRYSTEHSFFAIAYLYDEYIARLDSAITAYDEYLALYPSGTYTEFARNRYDFLQGIKVSQPLSPAAAHTSIESGQDQSRTSDTPVELGVSPEDSSSYEEPPSDMDEASPEQESVEP
ncbi:MAG: hypothetical protein JSU61_01025, partial [Fidelibacterota bacterium]